MSSPNTSISQQPDQTLTEKTSFVANSSEVQAENVKKYEKTNPDAVKDPKAAEHMAIGTDHMETEMRKYRALALQAVEEGNTSKARNYLDTMRTYKTQIDLKSASILEIYEEAERIINGTEKTDSN